VLSEAGLFYVQNREVVALSRSVDDLVADPAFARTARAALEREQVSRRVLERIAAVASRRQDHQLQLVALDRIARTAPRDRSVQIRRADTLRMLGRLTESEAVYRAQLAGDAAGARQ
jgi:hypothetical protein